MLQQNNKYKKEKGENKQQGTVQSRYIQSNKMFDKDEQNDGQHEFAPEGNSLSQILNAS